MANSILTGHQIKFLGILGQEHRLAGSFYLTGGTALAGFYIPYRYSEDLDFFSENEVDILAIQTFLKKNGDLLNIKKTEFQTSFNRNLLFLTLKDNSTLKTEFTYFPFTRMDKGKTEYGVQIDSSLDIAVNKLFTIYQRTAARDYMDLFQLCKTYNYNIPDLIAKARLKFDTHIDLLKLGSQFNKATQAADLPRLVSPLPEKDWHGFFLSEADKLKPEILS
ncbi:MAG: nucleotidyl transferase AbiEii/AbiGii toxin family protein [Patescibacteria group bacterium]|nr:nucleotidyl transferase AbiEii/AbiGii toxin family protein [Patescibacteria group bacterium]